MKRKLSLLLLVLALLVLAPCALAVSITDMMGRDIALDAPVTRVVAVTPADCEILCALGAGDVLVGRGEYCNYPQSVLEVPSVESGAALNLEQILALEPQVVLMGTMGQTVEQVEALQSAGAQVVVSNAQDIEGTYAAIRMIGALVGRDAEAEALVKDMQDTFESLKAEPTGKTVYFEVSPLQYGLWTAGANTFMDELAQLCGLTNAFADVDGWAAISEEQVLQRDPDYMVTISMDYGEGPTPVEEMLGREGWQNLKAVKNGAIFNADSDQVSRPGPRLKDAALALSAFVKGAE